jgi:beta-glucosidase
VPRYFALLMAAALLLSATTASSADQVAPPVILHPDLWPTAARAARDPQIEAFITQLLAHMTVREKIGQMIQADIDSVSPSDLASYPLGSILAGGNAAPNGNPRASAQDWLAMTDAYYQASSHTHGSHQAIPILFGIDAVHGNAKLVGATIFPHNVGLGAAHDPDLMRKIGAATAAEVAAVGIDWTFAPTVAVARDVRWGRAYESYSESPELVAQYAAQMVTGLQGQQGSSDFMSPGHTLASVKHFLGDGATLGGRDQAEAMVSEQELSTVHAAGYLAAINAGAMIVMASYNSWRGVKLHASHYLLTDILKGRLRFDGFVVGDWNAQEQVPGCTKDRCAAAILAGIDMLMAPDSWKALFNNTLAQVRSGAIPRARIDDAVRRILRVKITAGMFRRAPPKARTETQDFSQIGSAAHRGLAREAVRKSLVLLKNNRDLLPLSPAAKILVAGDAGDSISAQSGGWTVDWQGDHNTNTDFPGATSIYAGIKTAVQAAGGKVEFRPAGDFTEKPDVAIVVFGEAPYAEFQGDRETLQFSPTDKQDLKMLRTLRGAGIPVVTVFLSGRPLWVNPEINASDAFVAAWLPGSEGEGIADLLFGGSGDTHYNFTGRLAFSWPQTAMPVVFEPGQVTGAVFARGAGLDYSHTVDLKMLAEDSAVPPHWNASADSFFEAGHVIAPWSLFVADHAAEVHVTTSRQESPDGGLRVEVLPNDRGITATWTGEHEGMLRITGRSMNLQTMGKDAALEVRFRVDRAPDRAVRVGVRCTAPRCGTAAGAMIDVTPQFLSAIPGQWHSLTIPLACLNSLGADLTAVAIPFAMETTGRFSVTVSDVKRVQRATGTMDSACAARPANIDP